MQFLNDPLCWRASQLITGWFTATSYCTSRLVITVRFGSSLDQNPVLPAVSLELPTPSKWLQSAWNALNTRFQQSICQNYLGEGPQTTRGLRAFGARGLQPSLVGKACPCPQKSISPRTPMVAFFILGEKRKLRSTRTLGTPVSVVQIIQVSCRAMWIETNRPQSLTAATQNCSSSSLLSYTKIWWRYTQRNKSLIKIWFLPPLDVDEWRLISVVSRHHNTHIVFVPRLFWDTLRLKENGIMKWKKFRRYIDVGWST